MCAGYGSSYYDSQEKMPESDCTERMLLELTAKDSHRSSLDEIQPHSSRQAFLIRANLKHNSGNMPHLPGNTFFPKIYVPRIEMSKNDIISRLILDGVSCESYPFGIADIQIAS
jgi:hypothetical protein